MCFVIFGCERRIRTTFPNSHSTITNVRGNIPTNYDRGMSLTHFFAGLTIEGCHCHSTYQRLFLRKMLRKLDSVEFGSRPEVFLRLFIFSLRSQPPRRFRDKAVGAQIQERNCVQRPVSPRVNRQLCIIFLSQKLTEKTIQPTSAKFDNTTFLATFIKQDLTCDVMEGLRDQ